MFVMPSKSAKKLSRRYCTILLTMKHCPPQEQLGRNGRIGGDARLTSVGEWQGLVAALQREGLQLVHISTLVDQLWNEEPDLDKRRPDFIKTVANEHSLQYAGEMKLLLYLSVFRNLCVEPSFCKNWVTFSLIFEVRQVD